LNEEERVLTFQRQREKIKENGKRVYWKKEHYRGKKYKEKKKKESLHSRGRKERVLAIKIIEALVLPYP
jgi:hypothetical protein